MTTFSPISVIGWHWKSHRQIDLHSHTMSLKHFSCSSAYSIQHRMNDGQLTSYSYLFHISNEAVIYSLILPTYCKYACGTWVRHTFVRSHLPMAVPRWNFRHVSGTGKGAEIQGAGGEGNRQRKTSRVFLCRLLSPTASPDLFKVPRSGNSKTRICTAEESILRWRPQETRYERGSQCSVPVNVRIVIFIYMILHDAPAAEFLGIWAFSSTTVVCFFARANFLLHV